VKKLLGDGTFGRVLECKFEGILYAIKVHIYNKDR
jgi:hypothetical protein